MVGPHTHVNAGEEEDALEAINDSTRPTLPRMHTRAQSTAWDRLGRVKEKVKITGDVGATSSLASLSYSYLLASTLLVAILPLYTRDPREGSAACVRHVRSREYAVANAGRFSISD